jgi:hypothetical protein
VKSRATAEQKSATQELLTGAELRRRLSISPSTLHRHRLSRFAFRVGGTWRYRWSEILAFYERGGNGKES